MDGVARNRVFRSSFTAFIAELTVLPPVAVGTFCAGDDIVVWAFEVQCLIITIDVVHPLAGERSRQQWCFSALPLPFPVFVVVIVLADNSRCFLIMCADEFVIIVKLVLPAAMDCGDGETRNQEVSNHHCLSEWKDLRSVYCFSRNSSE